MILFTLLIDVMIKWKKWILELLPTSKRTLMMYALCLVLISPIVKLYGEFIDWRTRMRIKSGATPQTCMLRKIIKDELEIDVLIEEGNGKPTDFIIKTSFVNIDVERRLFALLDRYKLAGKNYGYENAEIRFVVEWTEYVCERGEQIVMWTKYVCEMAQMTAEWTKYVCEQTDKKLNTITTQLKGGGFMLEVVSTYPVNIPITLYYYRENDSNLYSVEYTGTVQYYDLGIGNKVIGGSFRLSHNEDGEYEYQIVNKN